MTTTFDPDDYELRWPPQLFRDEADRLLRIKAQPLPATAPKGTDFYSGLVSILAKNTNWHADVEWLLTEAFVSAAPVETFRRLDSGTWGDPKEGLTRPVWLVQLIRQAASWPESDTRRPYWSARTAQGVNRPRFGLVEVTQSFTNLIEEFESDGYFVQAFGQKCVDDDSPLPRPSAVLSRRLGYPVEWPLESPHITLDYLCDLIEVFHDLVARPSSRWYHDFSRCGWHYSAFASGPGRRLYRWRVNRLLAASTLGLGLADSGEDFGRLVRVEPTGLEDLPEQAVESAAPETVDRVRHAIALFRSRTASVEERRSAVIALAGILEERRNLLEAELLSKDEGALFQIANSFAVRHQRADQRSDYDSAFLDWFFWWYLATVELTNQLLARQTAGQG